MKDSRMTFRAEWGTCEVISLAAPVNRDRNGLEGAQLTARVSAEFFARNFDELYGMEEDVLQYAAVMCIKRALYDLCDSRQTDLRQLGSNLQLIALDHRTHRMIALHLGDGYILSFMDGKKKVVSYPRKGFGGRSRYITSMCPASPHLKVYRGDCHGTDRFMLVNGGRTVSVLRDSGAGA